MKSTSRRTILTSAAAVAGLPLLNDLAGRGRTAAAATAGYTSNTELYNSKIHKEGTHWARRFRRTPPHELIDNASAGSEPIRSTAIIAPHGGGIEEGTSELCLAIAGYTLAGSGAALPAPVPDEPQRDYWMFEGISESSALHVTSTLCDDPAALHICGSNMYAVSLHGFAGDTTRKVLIGGKDTRLKQNLQATFARHYGESDAARTVEVVIAGPDDPLDGDDPKNIVNRTRTGAGAQLEISRALRSAMFGDFTNGPSRRSTAGVGTGHEGYFWNGFVKAVREAVNDHERGVISVP
ncbi:poly-gamma-glutamate hydrolase family protein [Streptomyces sp. BE308]|uniref:poly-gamma-glutamate hydrolase family protein n=1 Tax=Streptomyces sp. BE308 TaxID=3002529 RepID=UPI002E76F70D|nr:poly-gamma-glutamate hydrolase family protein [Streptomyces sp. BE308]MEE1792358.1 poly-gamma-glutamate hydrolase family protein [Streptomyces sp. BE308]